VTTEQDVTAEPHPTPGRTSWRSLPPLALVPLAALTWWVVGFLPWLLNDAGHDIIGADGISTLAVPLFAGSVSALVLGGGLGGVAAGLTTLLCAGSRAVRAAACASGVAIALLVSLLQSRRGLSGVEGVGIDERVTNGLTVVTVLMTVVGVSLGLLCLLGRLGLGFALAAGAGAAPVWVMSVFNALRPDDSRAGLQGAHEVSAWIGAVVLAAALVAVGLRPAERIIAWLGVVLLAWIVSPTITAAAYMEAFLRPGMGLPDMWGDHLSATMDVWRMSASPEARSVTSWIVAIVVAGGVALWLARRPTDDPIQPAQ
jgi:hypothetical protein